MDPERSRFFEITRGSVIPISLRRLYHYLASEPTCTSTPLLNYSRWILMMLGVRYHTINPSFQSADPKIPYIIPRFHYGRGTLFNSSSDSRFHVPVSIQHARIAWNCLRVMGEQLRTNICNSEFPARYLDNSKTRHLLGMRISPELRYACMSWATHLHSADQDDDLFVLFDDFHFMHLLQ